MFNFQLGQALAICALELAVIRYAGKLNGETHIKLFGGINTFARLRISPSIRRAARR